MVAATLLTANVYCQNVTVGLTFTAENNGVYVRLDSVKVMNRTHSETCMIYWPDTTLSMEIEPGDLLLYVGYRTLYPVGTGENGAPAETFRWMSSSAFAGLEPGHSALVIPEKGVVDLSVSDLRGRVLAAGSYELEKGAHAFRFAPSTGSLYLVTATWKGTSQTIKLLPADPPAGKQRSIEYAGRVNGPPPGASPVTVQSRGMQEAGILSRPDGPKTYRFQFASNMPCIGMPIVVYEWQYLPTWQVFNQCWLKKNLNIGTMVDSLSEQTANGVIEKYCIGNSPDSCEKYGGLYQWEELMQYMTEEGSQGICPPGWHVPTDEEFKVLEGAADTEYGIGDPVFDTTWFRAGDAGTSLKNSTGWVWNGNGTDLLGFSALPGGRRVVGSSYSFYTNAGSCYWWTSTKTPSGSSAWMRYLEYGEPGSGRGTSCEGYVSGMLLRCLRDY